MSDFLFLASVALPQLRTTCPGPSVLMPVVSPGHTDGSPNCVETWNGSESHPPEIEKVRRKSAHPHLSPFHSHGSSDLLQAPPATSRMCGTSSRSGVAWI